MHTHDRYYEPAGMTLAEEAAHDAAREITLSQLLADPKAVREAIHDGMEMVADDSETFRSLMSALNGCDDKTLGMIMRCLAMQYINELVEHLYDQNIDMDAGDESCAYREEF